MSETLDSLYEIRDLLTGPRQYGNKQKAVKRLSRAIEIQEAAEGVVVKRTFCRHGLPADCCRVCWGERKGREEP